jgi:hypothetical protein
VEGKCNLITGFCLNSIQRQEEKFLECLLPGLNPFTVNFLDDKYGLGSKDPSSPTFQSRLKQAWTSEDCVSNNEIGTVHPTSLIVLSPSSFPSTDTHHTGLPFRNHYRSYFACDSSVCGEVAALDEVPHLPFSCVDCYRYQVQTFPTSIKTAHS